MALCPRKPDEALALLRRETRWSFGPVPRELAGHPVVPDTRVTALERHLFRSDSGIGYYYEPGAGITIERPDGCDPDEVGLWLNGSVYAAVACLNGFVPLHASAIAHQGTVIAFTGPSGAGKSTLVAGLGQRGLPLFCDDTLILDLTDPQISWAMPGHKRLKLDPVALDLTGAEAQGPVGAGTGKFYAAPPAGDSPSPLPLRWLVFLEEGPEPGFEPITGAARFARLDDDHYTQTILREAGGLDRAEIFAMRARLAGQIRMARLVRPRSPAGFAASLDRVERWIREQAGEIRE